MKDETVKLQLEELMKFYEEQHDVYVKNKHHARKKHDEAVLAALDEQYERIFEEFKPLFAASYCSERFDENPRVSFILPEFEGREINFIDLKMWSKCLKEKTSYMRVSQKGEFYFKLPHDPEFIGLTTPTSYEDIFSKDPEQLKPWDRELAEAVKAKEKELFYSVYDKVSKYLIEGLKAQFSRMAKNMEEKATHKIVIGPFHCASRICERVVSRVEKDLINFLVYSKLQMTDNGILIYLTVELHW